MIDLGILLVWLCLTCFLIMKLFYSLFGSNYISLLRKAIFFSLLLTAILITSSLQEYSWLQYPTSVLLLVLSVPTIYFSREQIFLLLVSIITIFLVSFCNFLIDILLNSFANEILGISKFPSWGHIFLVITELILVFIIPKKFFNLVDLSQYLGHDL
ncbi:hypothetical protein BAU18_001091 [Enterococcus diestrammenae]|uniref:Uncharacterized protein n=1 Tax=Enterococcus diestrammenae TaxID=1155073 RepID=A0ABV0F4D8_9ENTE|nr:hypothetical protein BAU18_08255 [Enterococcus diestrammenae]